MVSIDKITIIRRSDGKESQNKNETIEQRLLPAKCIKTGVDILVNLIRDMQGWCWQSTFNDGAGHSTSSSYSTDDVVLDGAQWGGSNFECAGCAAKTFVQCSSCRQLTCWSGQGLWTCVFCGKTGYTLGTIKSAIAVSDGKKLPQ